MKTPVLSGLLLVAATLAQADSLTFNPTKDTTAKEHFPGANYGTDLILQASAQVSYGKQIFVQFTVSGIPAGASNITAQVKLSSQVTATGRAIAIHSASNTSWGETSLTWSNKPALGTTRDTVSSHTAGVYSVWNVTAAVPGNGTYAFGLDTTYSGDTTFESRESTNQPKLVVTYTTGPTRQSINKPLLICEGGWEQGLVKTAGDGFTYSKDGANAQRCYIDQMRTDIKASPDVIGYVAWNNKSSDWNDFIDTGNSLTHYKNWVNDSWFTLYRQ